MTHFVSAYQDRNVKEAEEILSGQLSNSRIGAKVETIANRATKTDDPFIAFFKQIRTQYIVDLIKPDTGLKFDWLAFWFGVTG